MRKLLNFRLFPVLCFVFQMQIHGQANFRFVRYSELFFFLRFIKHKIKFVNSFDVHTKFFHMTPLDQEGL